jgi:hypothetical protein
MTDGGGRKIAVRRLSSVIRLLLRDLPHRIAGHRRSIGRIGRSGLRLRPSCVHALAQQLEEALLRHRRLYQDALAEIAAHHHQGLQVGRRFDAFRDRCAAEAVSEIDCGLANRCICGVGRTILHESFRRA